MAKTLLAVHAHPDNETITMGGTLARYSTAGVRTVVVTCTRGDLGEARDPTLLRDGDVAALRDRELDSGQSSATRSNLFRALRRSQRMTCLSGSREPGG